jgi:hypothetical protein
MLEFDSSDVLNRDAQSSLPYLVNGECLAVNVCFLFDMPFLHLVIETLVCTLFRNFIWLGVIVVENSGFIGCRLTWEVRIPKEVDVLPASLLH